MGNPKNNYLARQNAQQTAFMHTVELIVKQYMIDTLQMTLNEEEGWGYDKIMRLMEPWKKNRDKYSPALNHRDPESDVARYHMDRVLEQIIRGKAELIPFEERYPDVKKVKY